MAIELDFRSDFVETTVPLLEPAEAALVRVAEAWRDGRHDEAAWGVTCSALHTIKGNAGLVGLTHLATYVHEVEALAAAAAAPAGRTTQLARALLSAFALIGAAVQRGDDQALDDDALRTLAAMGRGDVARDVAAGASAIEPHDVLPVRADHVDQLVAMLGELHQQWSQLAREQALDNDPGASRLGATLRAVMDAAADLRLVPVRRLFGRFRRRVFELAQAAGVEADLVTEGDALLVDKGALDALAEPVLHVVRNAFAHGLEPAAERRAQGKPARGRVRLSAAATAHEVRVVVEDDGRGVDVERLRAKVRERGRDPGEFDLVGLLTSAGVSTREVADQLAGRGVGMGAVARSLADRGGGLTATTRRGRGTRFELRVPARSALLRGVTFRVGTDTFIAPQRQVLEGVRLGGPELARLESRWVLRWRDQVLPCVDARAAFGASCAVAPAAALVVVPVAEVAQPRALLVDDLHTTVEGVPQRLGSELPRPAWIDTFLLLPTGVVAPVLDLHALTEARA